MGATAEHDAPVTDPHDANPAAVRPSPSDRPLAVFAAGLACVLVGLRIWIVSVSTMPRVMADEAGTWAIAQFVGRGGDVGINMLNQPPYPVLPGILVAPLTWLPSTAAQYRSFQVMAVIALVGGAWLASNSIAKFIPLTVGERVAITVIGAAYPAVFFTTSFSWSEFIVPAYWGAMIAMAWTLREPDRLRSAAAAGVVAGLAPLIHGRFLGVAVVWIAANIWLVVRARPDDRRQLFAARTAGVATCLTVTAGSIALNSFIVGRVWVEAGGPGRTEWLSGLDDLFFYKIIFTVVLGQLWYLLTATFGLAAVGLAAIVVSFRRIPDARLALTTIAMIMVTNFAASCLFMAGNAYRTRLTRSRYDHLFYGRYVDGIGWLLFIVGVAALFAGIVHLTRSPWFAVTVAALMLGSALVLEQLISRIESGTELLAFFGPTASGVWVLPGETETFDILHWTVVAVLVMLVVLGPVAAGRDRLALASLGAALVGTCLLAAQEVRGIHDRWQYETSYQTVPPPTPGNESVIVAIDVVDRSGYSLLIFGQQYQLVNDGWSFEFPSAEATVLLAEPPAHAGLIVVPIETDVSGLTVVGQAGPAVFVLPPAD